MRNILILSCLLISYHLSAQNEPITSKWTMQEISVDGSGEEWELPLIYGDEKISYSFSNNNENFTLLVQTFNRSLQQKIMRSGMIITISTKGKNKRKIVVSFPLKSIASANTQRLAPDSEGNPPNTDQRSIMRQQFVDNCTEMRVKGLESVKGKIPISNEFGILAAINWETENLLCYELQIPIKEIIPNANPNEYVNNNIEIKIQVNALPQPGSGGTGVSQSGGKGGRSGSRGGGGARGSRPGAQTGGAKSAMFTPDVFKAKFILSNSK